jgi:hypothetical protein
MYDILIDSSSPPSRLGEVIPPGRWRLRRWATKSSREVVLWRQLRVPLAPGVRLVWTREPSRLVDLYASIAMSVGRIGDIVSLQQRRRWPPG